MGNFFRSLLGAIFTHVTIVPFLLTGTVPVIPCLQLGVTGISIHKLPMTEIEGGIYAQYTWQPYIYIYIIYIYI